MRPPYRALLEHAWYRASRGRMLSWDPAKRDSWHPAWLTATDDLEGRRTAHGFVSTCAIFVNTLLRDCGCLEPWVLPKWISGAAIRRWPRELEIRRPTIDQLFPGSILLWRASTSLAHVGVFLADLGGGLVLTAEGGQPGGRVKCRELGYPDCAVPLDRLAWSEYEPPTVGQWLEQCGLAVEQCCVEQFLPESALMLV